VSKEQYKKYVMDMRGNFEEVDITATTTRGGFVYFATDEYGKSSSGHFLPESLEMILTQTISGNLVMFAKETTAEQAKVEMAKKLKDAKVEHVAMLQADIERLDALIAKAELEQEAER